MENAMQTTRTTNLFIALIVALGVVMACTPGLKKTDMKTQTSTEKFE
jgi:hypothetical protein